METGKRSIRLHQVRHVRAASLLALGAASLRLHISRLFFLPSALKISQLVTTGRGARSRVHTRFSHHGVLGSYLDTRVRLRERRRRTEDGGRRGRDVPHSRTAQRHIFRAKFANCVKRANERRLGSAGNLLETGRKSGAVSEGRNERECTVQ